MARIDGLARFRVKQNLDYAADAFEAEVNNAGLFTAADPGDAVSLYHGFKDVSGAELTVGRLTDGVVDEYVLKVTPSSVTEQLIGRDKNAWLLDRSVSMQFLRSPRRQVLQRLAITPPQPTAAYRTFTGRFTARTICQTILNAVTPTLALAWKLPGDYVLLDDFSAVGRVIDVLHALVDPYAWHEAFKVDVFNEGNSVVIQQRNPISPPVDWTYSVHDARIQSLEIRKRRNWPIGLLTFVGSVMALDPNSALPLAGVTFSGNTSDQAPDSYQQQPDAERQTTNETLDVDGTVLSRQTSTSTYRMPDNILTGSRTQTYVRRSQSVDAAVASALAGVAGADLTPSQVGDVVAAAMASAKDLTLSEEVIVTNTFEDSAYDSKGPISSPRQVEKRTETWGFAINPGPDQTWQQTRAERTTYSYDDQQFLTGETTTLEVLLPPTPATVDRIPVPLANAGTYVTPAKAGKLDATSMTIIEYVDKAALIYETRTFVYKKVLDPATSEKNWKLKTTDARDCSGYRPGGPNRKRPPRQAGVLTVKQLAPGVTITPPIVVPFPNDGEPQQSTQYHVLTSSLDAVNMTVSNKNFSGTDWQRILAQARAISGLAQVTLVLSCVAMPWIRTGSVLLLTGITDAVGTPISLQPALVVQCDTDNSEGPGGESAQRARIQAVFWGNL